MATKPSNPYDFEETTSLQTDDKHDRQPKVVTAQDFEPGGPFDGWGWYLRAMLVTRPDQDDGEDNSNTNQKDVDNKDGDDDNINIGTLRGESDRDQLDDQPNNQDKISDDQRCVNITVA